eukprot:2439265-Pyramimonas_sp.AAC.1
MVPTEAGQYHTVCFRSASGALIGSAAAIVLGRGSGVSSRWARECLTELLGWCKQPFSRV